LVIAMLLGLAIMQSVSAPSADAWHRHWGWGHRWGGGWGWGHHRWGGWGGWGHRNWGFGRGYVYRGYRPFYGGYYGGYRGYYPSYGYGYGFPSVNYYYPSVNYGFYPNYGYSNYGYYDGCQTIYYSQPNYGQPVYETQTIPGTQFDAGAVIAQVANVIRERRANNPDGRLLAGRIFDGDGRLFNGNGIGNGRLQGVVQNIVGGRVQNEPANGVTNVRFSNPDARAKARAYMTQGDNLFREQRYAAAAQQYRAAASMAPDLAESNWRYAHTLVAMGEYDLAVNAVDRALAASDDTTRGGFNLDTLYGTVGTAKASHLEWMASQSLQSESPNAYFLLGMTMHYSGETQRAEKFFARAAELQGRDVGHLVAFLGPPPKAIPEPPPMLARFPANET
jgi:tetratricopeptide (TPR) repeat protein